MTYLFFDTLKGEALEFEGYVALAEVFECYPELRDGARYIYRGKVRD